MSSTFTANLNLQQQGVGDNSNTWGTLLNSAVLANIDLAAGGAYSTSVAGSSDFTISATNALNLYHIPTGILTGNINYVFPASAGRLVIIYNNTTGSFTLTVKQSGGTGVVVPQGTRQIVLLDANTTTAYLLGVSSTLTSTNILVGNASNVATAVAMSGDATLSNAGAMTIANSAVTTAKINASAVTYAKMQSTSAAALLGASSAAALGEITLGKGLAFSGSTLNASGQYKTGNFTRDVSTASGTQSVTGIGFTPKLVVFKAIFSSGGNTASMCWGEDDGTTAQCVTNLTGAFAPTIDSSNSIDIVNSGGNASTAKITAFGADGFTVTWVKTGSPTGILTIYYAAHG